LRLATWLGFAVSGIAILGILFALYARFFARDWVQGWTSIVSAVLFLGGVQLICLGIIGEYVGRIYGESKRRPLYLVRERWGFRAPTRRAELDSGAQPADEQSPGAETRRAEIPRFPRERASETENAQDGAAVRAEASKTKLKVQ